MTSFLSHIIRIGRSEKKIYFNANKNCFYKKYFSPSILNMSGGLDYEEEMDNLPKDLLDYPDDVEMEESNPSPDSSSSSKGPSPDPSKKRKIPQKKPASPKKAKTSKKSKSSINPVYGLVPLLKTHLVVWFHETHRDVCNEKRDVWIQTIQQLMQPYKSNHTAHQNCCSDL